MALITERIMKNAEKCKVCVIQKWREMVVEKKQLAGRGVLDRDSAKVLYEGYDRLLRLSCNICPKQKDFVKVYGITPHEYVIKYGVSKKEKN